MIGERSPGAARWLLLLAVLGGLLGMHALVVIGPGGAHHGPHPAATAPALSADPVDSTPPSSAAGTARPAHPHPGAVVAQRADTGPAMGDPAAASPGPAPAAPGHDHGLMQMCLARLCVLRT